MKKTFVFLLASLLILGLNFQVVAHSDNEQAHEEETHDQLSARIFAVDYQANKLFYIDAPDYHLEGVVSLAPFTDVIVNEAGRFIVAVDEATNLAQVWSTGLFLEADGDHYDLVAVNPSMYWSFVIGQSPKMLSTTKERVVIVNAKDHTVSLVQPESGVVITVPAGSHGRALLVDNYLMAIDLDYDLLDVFDVEHLQRELSLRIPANAGGLASDLGYLWIATNLGLEIVELGHSYEQMTLPVQWNAVPESIYVQPHYLWVYGIGGNTFYAVSSLNGQVIYVEDIADNLMAVDSDHHYMAVSTADTETIVIIDVGHGAPRIRNQISMEAVTDQPISAVTWVGKELVVAAGDTIFIMDNLGHIAESIVIDGNIDKLLVSTIMEREYSHDHQGHSHDHGHDH